MTGKPFHNPFAALADLRGTPATDAEAPPQSGAAATAGDKQESGVSRAGQPADGRLEGSRRGPARAVVRLERSGRGGKAVTVIDHLGLPAADRDDWLKGLKASLGCGGTLEEDAIVLQGDQRSRVPALLTARGVRKVTVG